MVLVLIGYSIKRLICLINWVQLMSSLDFPVVYASALNGYAGLESDVRDGDMTPLFEAIIKEVPEPGC